MRIAIAGYGVEGESNYKYWAADKNNQLTIVDQKKPERELPENVSTIFGEDALEKLDGFDLVVRTAGMAPRKIKTDGKIWSATNEFFAKCPCEIIGVTGSKGKGTTASLITNILREAGRKVWLIGNIGQPSLDVLSKIKPTDIVVYELSSFQLWDIEKSPHVAVVLFIEREHQDVHLDMDEYINAKANITRYQSSDDTLIFNQSNEYSAKIAEISKAHKIGYQDKTSAHVESDYFYYGDMKICPINVLKLVGAHNLDNASAAIDAIWNYTNDSDVIARGLGSFSGLPHRLQFVREVNDVKYYDDSIATTPGSAIASLRAFEGPKVIILGGSSKGSDFAELGRELLRHDVKAILIGAEAETIANACSEAGFYDFEIIKNPIMSEIVKKAEELAVSGATVLLSPASASFGLFKNYADRGDQFVSAVRTL